MCVESILVLGIFFLSCAISVENIFCQSKCPKRVTKYGGKAFDMPVFVYVTLPYNSDVCGFFFVCGNLFQFCPDEFFSNQIEAFFFFFGFSVSMEST